METFSALLSLCAGNSPVTGEFHAQRPVTRSFDVFFDLRLNKRLSKQSWGWWFKTPSRPSWRHCNALPIHATLYRLHYIMYVIHILVYTLDPLRIWNCICYGLAISIFVRVVRRDFFLIYSINEGCWHRTDHNIPSLLYMIGLPQHYRVLRDM